MLPEQWAPPGWIVFRFGTIFTVKHRACGRLIAISTSREQAERVILLGHPCPQGRALALAKMDEVDRMPGDLFEKLIADLFERKGYAVESTAGPKDYGVDLIVTRGSERIAIQCKRREPSEVLGPAPIQEVFAGKRFYQHTKALVVTNARFSKHSRAMATKLGVELWDRDRLATEHAQREREPT